MGNCSLSNQQFQIQNQLSAFQPLRPHPPTPSPKLGRRGAGAKSLVSCSLSQTWERAGVRANQCCTPSEFLNLELLLINAGRGSLPSHCRNCRTFQYLLTMHFVFILFHSPSRLGTQFAGFDKHPATSLERFTTFGANRLDTN
jgi:hypothetical protein